VGIADPLADVLASVHLRGAVFFRVECAPPWAAENLPAEVIAREVMPGVDHVIEFHAVTRGRCLGGILGEPAAPLAAGDVICFPQGDPHVLSSAPGLRAGPAPSTVEALHGQPLPFHVKYGQGTTDVELVCGFIGCDARPFNPLLAALPRVLRTSDRAGPRQGWLSQFLAVAEAESRAPGPGAAGVLSRLSELMFVELVRRHVAELPPARTGWLAGLADPHVGRALAALHARPAEPWTLEGLARVAGLARSSLAERFAALVGEPPMQYLTRWRMQLAAGLLSGSGEVVGAVAAQVGYASEAAFHRAFKKVTGVPPARWRRRRREAPSAPGAATPAGPRPPPRPAGTGASRPSPAAARPAPPASDPRPG
jgi:AraC-like DNA-binding protein